MKKMLIYALLMALGGSPLQSYAERASEGRGDGLEGCNRALNACVDLVKAQDSQIGLLKAQLEDLSGQLADSQGGITIPSWIYLTLGAVGGIVSYRLLNR